MWIILPNMLITQRKPGMVLKNIVNLKKTSKRTTQLNIGGKIIDNNNEIATNFNIFMSMLDLALKNQFLKFLI